jgi:hypothetical protein
MRRLMPIVLDWLAMVHADGARLSEVQMEPHLWAQLKAELQETHPGKWRCFRMVAPWGFVDFGPRRWR